MRLRYPHDDRPDPRRSTCAPARTSRRRWWGTTSSPPTRPWSRPSPGTRRPRSSTTWSPSASWPAPRRPASTGMLANRAPPRLTPYDRFGNRVDEVAFHPSWHWLMERAVGQGLAAAPWESDSPHAHVRRAAGFMAWSHTEPGHGCPVSMTYAAVPALRADDALAKEWTPLLASTTYDPGLRPVAEKRGALAGMGMTEKQGGSDVRANVTRARSHRDRRRVHAPRPQVVHLRPDERRVPGARAGRPGGVDLLRGPAGAARRHPQPARRRPAQGQARQPLQRLERARARRHASATGSATRAAGCAPSSRWSPRPGSTACSARPR